MIKINSNEPYCYNRDKLLGVLNMNNFDKLNDVIVYIENNLANSIDSKKICQILCVNEYTAYRIFNFITGISITEYVRNRRLSMAGLDLINSNIKIIDLALKYGYDSPISFSRAFKKFHGINPSEVQQDSRYLKNFPPFTFSVSIPSNMELDFRIQKEHELNFYSISKTCDLPNIKVMAPIFWKETELNDNYKELFNDITFGIIEYDELFPNPKTATYHIASQNRFNDSSKLTIPASTWAIFNVKDISGKAMSDLSFYVYKNWIPYSGYNIRNIPELEVYHKDYTEWWLPIE